MAERAAYLPFPPESAAPPERPPRLVVLAERLTRTIGLARALAQNGRHVDLTGIEDGVGLLCAQTLDLSPVEGKLMLPLLYEMVGQVDALTLVIRQASVASSGLQKP